MCLCQRERVNVYDMTHEACERIVQTISVRFKLKKNEIGQDQRKKKLHRRGRDRIWL